MPNPEYLTCPFCPAQSLPTKGEINIAPNVYLQQYQCPAKHFFYVPQEIN